MTGVRFISCKQMSPADLLLHPHVFQHGSEPAYNQNDFYNKKLNFQSDAVGSQRNPQIFNRQ